MASYSLSAQTGINFPLRDSGLKKLTSRDVNGKPTAPRRVCKATHSHAVGITQVGDSGIINRRGAEDAEGFSDVETSLSKTHQHTAQIISWRLEMSGISLREPSGRNTIRQSPIAHHRLRSIQLGHQQRLVGYSHNLPKILPGCTSIPADASTIGRYYSIIQQAQAKIDFALIWEHRQTRAVMVAGFSTLGEMVQSIGHTVQNSLKQLIAIESAPRFSVGVVQRV